MPGLLITIFEARVLKLPGGNAQLNQLRTNPD